MYRLFFIIEGAQHLQRAGGPWWYRDFAFYQDLNETLRAMEPCLHCYAIQGVGYNCPVEMCDGNVYPPQGVDITYLQRRKR